MVLKIIITPTYSKKKWLANAAPILKYVHKQLTSLWKDSVKIFIEAALKEVHVDTGMSAASFQPLAAEVGMKTAIIQSLRGFGPKRGHKNIRDSRFQDNVAQYKSRALGQRLGEKAYDLDFGDHERPIFKFTFKIVIFQYYLHENSMNYSDSQNWQSLNQAKTAFLEYYNGNLSKYVKSKDIIQWLLTGRIR